MTPTSTSGATSTHEDGPYYLMAYKPAAVHYTMGGLHINTDAQVLDDAETPIAGLYAAGEVAGHKMARTARAPAPCPISTRSGASPARTPPRSRRSVTLTRSALCIRIHPSPGRAPPSRRGPFSGTIAAAHSRRTRRNTEGASMDQHLIFAISRSTEAAAARSASASQASWASRTTTSCYSNASPRRAASAATWSRTSTRNHAAAAAQPQQLLLRHRHRASGWHRASYKTEVDILKSIADEGPCVIVGRCADYVLDGHPGLVSLFVSAPMEARIARVMRRNDSEATRAVASPASTRTAPTTTATSPTRTGARRATTTSASTPATWTHSEQGLSDQGVRRSAGK